jgi:hypothetical protein
VVPLVFKTGRPFFGYFNKDADLAISWRLCLYFVIFHVASYFSSFAGRGSFLRSNGNKNGNKDRRHVMHIGAEARRMVVDKDNYGRTALGIKDGRIDFPGMQSATR